MVVINKIDKSDARPDWVLDKVFDLFVELEANDDQLEFPVIYASAKNGWAVKELEDPRENMVPLLDAVLENIPAPKVLEGPVQMQVTTLDYNDYVGRIGIGRVFRGNLDLSKPMVIIKRDGSQQQVKVKQLYTFEGIKREETSFIQCGDLCAICGITGIDIGDTVTDAEFPEALPLIKLDEPNHDLPNQRLSVFR